MLRIVTSLLMLSLLTGGLEAATDFGGIQQGDASSAHEVHGDFHDDDSGSPDSDGKGKDPRHFCHCTAHGPAVIMSISLPAFAATVTIGSTINRLQGTQRLPPLLRPPNLG
jgi:hypothetical protein